MYALDLDKFIQWLLPTAIRKAVMVAWLNALAAPLKWLHGRFLIFASEKRYEIQITGQVRVLEYHLHRLFDPYENIYIEDASDDDPLFVYLESENQPLYLPTFITGSQVDFIVHCPNNITAQETAIRAFLDKYKLPTKRYELLFDITVI